MRGSWPALDGSEPLLVVVPVTGVSVAVVAVGADELELDTLELDVPELDVPALDDPELAELLDDGADELELLGAEDEDGAELEDWELWLPARGSTYCWSPAEPLLSARAPIGTAATNRPRSSRAASRCRIRSIERVWQASQRLVASTPAAMSNPAPKSWFCRIYCITRIPTPHRDRSC